MRKDTKIRIYWRYLIILALVVALAGWIISNEVTTTVVNADEWNAKAERTLNDSSIVAPERGDILSADGKVLATNLKYYNLRIDYGAEGFRRDTLLAYVDALSDSLAKYYPKRNAAEWRSYLTEPLSRSKRPRYFPVLKNLNIDQFNQVKSFPYFKNRRRNRSGLICETFTKRAYPYGKMAKRSIGHVNQSKPDEIHGFSGIEASLDTLLYGVPGISHKMPMLTGIYDAIDVRPIRGYDVVTTIDIGMQEIVENELNDRLAYTDAEWGVAVLMEVATGDIKAISNLEKERVETDTATHTYRYTGRIIEGMNRAVMGFEPGSVVKPISMLVALETGAVTSPNQVFPIGASFAYAGGRPIRDSHFNASLTAEGIIEQSSNIGMTRIITSKFGANPQKFKDELVERGFFEPMLTGIAGERVPKFVPLTGDGSRVNLSRVCYGYASEIPPIYTLSIYNAIANGGRYVRPHLVNRIIGNGVDSTLNIKPIRERICTEKNAKILQQMLTKVVWGDHGTAKRLRDENVAIAGKTGTCIVIDDKTHQYLKGVYRFAFCGFFPADKPQYSCIVLISRPREGALTAAHTSGETLKNIALKMYSRGMLKNHSDYKATSNPGQPYALLSALLSKNEVDALSSLVGGNYKVTKNPVTAATDTVPNVVGLSLPKAISILENKGFDVAFTGTGHVVGQSREGKKVKLTLKF
ncbi:MAG: transpeptidase family protein [Muribaculaceae bacterium]|nr:transpeptidase family protein [Muribaculaceae bacterium]